MNNGGETSAVGYGKPPASSRFRKGQSGNPKGRPPGRREEAPYEAVLGQMVAICEDGMQRQVTAAEAFILHITKLGLEGDSAAARAAMAAIENARARRSGSGEEALRIGWKLVSPGSVNTALEPLRMARKQDRHRETAQVALEPWLVETALDRLGQRRLSIEEQRIVVRATPTPSKVRWPAWWQVRA